MASAPLSADEADDVSVIDLRGQWQFQTDRWDRGRTSDWASRSRLDDTIMLPGSMLTRGKGDSVTTETEWICSLYDSSFFYSPALAKYREPDNFKATFFLTPDHHYVGPAWYNRTIEVPASFVADGCRSLLYLERPHIETTLYVNGKSVGSCNSLCVAHEYDVTPYLQAGKNLIALRIDNRLAVAPVGKDSHSVTDQTQGDWNGVVGRMELRRVPATHILQTDIFPDVTHHSAQVRYVVTGQPGQYIRLELKADAYNTLQPHSVPAVQYDGRLTHGTDTLTVTLPMGDDVQLWDEFQPAMYRLETVLSTRQDVKRKKPGVATAVEHQTENFGMREFGIQGRMFVCNGREVQLRGTVENCDFPLTGYAPMDVESWMQVFRTCREWGLNHMRFHSYCPPEAAFVAADLTGFYLQPEGPSWPNHGVKLGQRQPIDSLLMAETQAMVRAYGNHPSFCMMACGNEPAGNWVPWVSQFVDYWKATDPRRVYTGASVGGGWAWQPKSEYHVKSGARGLGNWVNRAPETESDFSAQISHYKAKDGEWDINEPYVSHETGQWCAFPDFDEIQRYTGPNKAKNFEVFRDILAANGMAGRARDFLMASGKLQALCYKYEIERTLRTPNYAGFQLLSLNDYSGQGTALVGVQNVFFEPKGYISAREWREFCSPIVPLASFPKFTYSNLESFSAEISINDHGQLQSDKRIEWTITDEAGNLLSAGTTSRVNASLRTIETAQKVTLRANVYEMTPAASASDLPVGSNHWDFWVYPSAPLPELGSRIRVVETFDQRTLMMLNYGFDVLLLAGDRVKYGSDVVQHFLPVFWNTSWFKMRPPHTTGLFIEEQHPIFRYFPTSYHSDLQWWELVNKTPVMQFDEFPADFQPLVQSIDTWFLSRKIGVLFEARVGKGRLIMTTMDLTSELDQRLVARQMLTSILKYMQSNEFNPRHTIAPETIKRLFTQDAPPIKMFTKESPDELKPKLK